MKKIRSINRRDKQFMASILKKLMYLHDCKNKELMCMITKFKRMCYSLFLITKPGIKFPVIHMQLKSIIATILSSHNHTGRIHKQLLYIRNFHFFLL